MKKIMIMGFLVLFLAPMVWAQETIEAPVWNVGDKWEFTGNTSTEIIGVEETNYVMKYSDRTGDYLSILEKSTLNRTHTLEGEKRKVYRGGRKRLLNFPLSVGKKWKDTFSSRARGSTIAADENLYYETYTILGWENIKVKAGEFKAIKLEYKQEGKSSRGDSWEGKAWYWYSPEAKYFVKCEYDRSMVWREFRDWELVSFHLK